MNQVILSNLNEYLSQLYRPELFKDGCTNGLLVAGKEKIAKGITAVSFSLEAVQAAVTKDCDFLLVHHPHGMWNNQSRVVQGALKEKLSLLLKHGISLFAFHLPMDAHEDIGNNACILKELGLEHCGGFLPNGKSQFIGSLGKYSSPISKAEFLNRIKDKIGPANAIFSDGKNEISVAAICSGGAASSINEAMALGADILVTGEPREETWVFCQDEGFNFVAAGHHQTEIFGPRAAAENIRKNLQLDCEFLDLPNPI